MTRTGKIARLPRELRDELNRRLENGEMGVRLVEWLNSEREAQTVLKAEFEGQPISEANLTNWKAGGYREWLARREVMAHAREVAADGRELAAAIDGRLTDHLATALAARYAAALAGLDGERPGEFDRKLQTLRELCHDVVELRRGDHSGARLDLEVERLEREREKTAKEVLGYFKEWLKKPQLRLLIANKEMTDKEREQRMDEIFDVAPQKPEASPAEGVKTG